MCVRHARLTAEVPLPLFGGQVEKAITAQVAN